MVGGNDEAELEQIFGLDFPLGVQTLGLACSLMMMESNYAVHVL